MSAVDLSASRVSGLNVFGDRPGKARQFSSDRGRDHCGRFSSPGELAIAPTQPLLGLPRSVADRLCQTLLVAKNVYNHVAAGLDEVQANFRVYKMLDGRVKFLKGWFKDTLPAAPIKSLAVMRLDGDYYELTMDLLVNLYDKLSIGGYAIIYDYGEDSWTYCEKAVNDYRRAHGAVEPMIWVDKSCYYWRRTR